MAHTRGRLTSILTALLIAVACTSSHAASIARVQRLIAPGDAARLAARGLRPDAAPMRAEELAAGRARAAAARGIPHVLTAPGVDWSSSANRRVGWTRPPHRPRITAAGHAAALGLPPPDTLRVAILRIDFLRDRGGTASTGDGHFETQIDTLSPPIDRPPRNLAYFQKHGEALARFYDTQTYGRVVVQTDVWPRDPAHADSAYHATDMADFGPWKFSQSVYRAAVHMMRTMFFVADSQSIVLGDRIPWDHYDRFVIIHAGSDLQSDIRQDSKEDIPSFTVGLADTDVIVFPDSTTRAIDRASFVPETINQDGYYGAINGVLAHECGHNFFGFYDVYDIESGYPVVGYWSLMDSGNQVGARVGLKDGTEIFATGLLPPSIDPFQRAWTSDVVTLARLQWDAVDSLRASERYPDIRRVDLSADEYLLLENRHLSPADSVQLDQDSTTHVILGPKTPDGHEYDALLPGGGVLVWHVDASVVALESSFPLDTALRVNPDFGLNTNPDRLGLSVVEADGLGDLGDPSSPYWLGSFLDPFFVGNNTVLADSTAPSLIPHIGTKTHIRLDVLDSLTAVMRVRASRTWALPGFPRRVPFRPGGAQLVAVSATGDARQQLAWAGGTLWGADSADVFLMGIDGLGPHGGPPALKRLERRPDPILAALPIPAPSPGALFAVVTRAAFPGDTIAGRLHLLDDTGAERPGFPVRVGAGATPPVIAGTWPNAGVFVGQDDRRVHAYSVTDGTAFFVSDAMPDSITGRLAANVLGAGPDLPAPGAAPELVVLVAAGSRDGSVMVTGYGNVVVPQSSSLAPGWLKTVSARPAFAPDFLWIPFGGDGAAANSPCATPWTLVVRDVDRLYAYCAGGEALPGWGRALPDTLVPSLGAGDPSGDGYPEVLVQTIQSGAAFVGVSGGPSPGWPKRPTDEFLRTGSPVLAADVDGDGRSEVVAMDASGIVAALRASGKQPAGWPLATGAGAMGAPVIADLDGDGFLELVAPDNVDQLWGYALGAPASGRAAAPWPMLGGDPGRTCTLPLGRAPVALAPSAGPLVPGTLMAYPNPARRRPVNFAYTLTEPASVEFRVLDASGHQVAAFARDGRQSGNLETWEPGALPAGLYLVQVRIRAAGGREHHEILPVGLLR